MSSPEDSSDPLQIPPKNENSHGSLEEKKSRLLAAVVENQLDVFIDLFDSPELYDTNAYASYSYLQLAILRDSKEVFDYMLSIPNFPLEYANQRGETALTVALNGFIAVDQYTKEYFACELVKKGASLEIVCFLGNTPLHCAVQREHWQLLKLLLEKGVDLNARNRRGQTPLELVPVSSSNIEETVTTLLMRGAEPSVKLFEKCVLENSSLHLQETLFLYLFDEFSTFEITFDVLFKIIDTKSSIFDELIKCPVVLKNGVYDMFVYFRVLCKIGITYLEKVIVKFGDSLRQALINAESFSRFRNYQYTDPIKIENLNLLLESSFNLELLDFIDVWNIGPLPHLAGRSYTESSMTEIYCCLLSYGFEIGGVDLQTIYERFGYCQLFKILLYMDIKAGVPQYYVQNIMAVLIYDVNKSLTIFLENPNKYTNMGELLDHFVDSKLRVMYLDRANKGLVSKKANLPEIPLLLELARNEFRKFFVEKFHIKSSKEFYSLLKCLPISNVYRKMITYETKLY